MVAVQWPTICPAQFDTSRDLPDLQEDLKRRPWKRYCKQKNRFFGTFFFGFRFWKWLSNTMVSLGLRKFWDHPRPSPGPRPLEVVHWTFFTLWSVFNNDLHWKNMAIEAILPPIMGSPLDFEYPRSISTYFYHCGPWWSLMDGLLGHGIFNDGWVKIEK